MKILNTEFTFHNVGQGLFYSGRIDQFNFVYDCGASKQDKRYLEKSIVEYKHEVDKLDLLILSHLHEDHVLGLYSLLKDINVHTVVLPYLLPIERLMISLVRLDHSLWYYEFLSDPVTFLLNNNVKRIVLIGGKEGRFPEEPPTYVPSENQDPDLGELPNDENLRNEVLTNDPQLKELLDKTLFIKNHNGYTKALGQWFFRFFNYKEGISPQKFNNFKKCIEQTLKPNYNLIKIIASKSLSPLRKCYVHIRPDQELNDTSLVTYHGPIKPTNQKHSINFRCNLPYCNFLQYISPSTCLFSFTVHYSNRNGQLLMGDINLNTNFQEVERHYRPYFPNTYIIQVPHHGSVKNWNAQMTNILPNKTICIASAGTRNNYGHPDLNVVFDIKTNHKFIWCNEFSSVQI